MINWLSTLSGMVARAKAQFQYSLGTAAFAIAGLLLCVTATGFMIAAFYTWLDVYWPSYLALLCTAGGLLLPAIILLMVARRRSRPSYKSLPGESAFDGLTDEAERAAHRAATAARLNVRHAPTGALLAAVAVGVAVGLLRPSDRP